MGKFRVGQKVRIVRPEPFPTGFQENKYGEVVLYGKIVTISALPFSQDGFLRYPTDIDWNGQIVAPIEPALAPLYDGDTPASWETCAWRPKETVLAPSS